MLRREELLDRVGDRGVVDRGAQRVGRGRGARVDVEAHVDRERLEPAPLAGVHPDARGKGQPRDAEAVDGPLGQDVHRSARSAPKPNATSAAAT